MTANINIRSARGEDLAVISKLAERIWREHYIPIIGSDQVEYMLGLWYSVDVLQQQLADKERLFLVAEVDGIIKAYMQATGQDDGFMFIHKIYVASECRGMGVGKLLLNHLPNEQSIKLRVNKNNSDSIAFYNRQGFEIYAEDVLDIGGGFVMDDYIMQKLQ